MSTSGNMSEDEYPQAVQYALNMLGIQSGSQPEKFVEALRHEWGQIDSTALISIPQETTGKQRLFALLALGYPGYASSEEAARILLWFLQSSNAPERWASALGLGHLHVSASQPVLLRMLTEFAPPDSDLEDVRDDTGDYGVWPGWVPPILAAWGKSAFIPPLRQALMWAVRRERTIIDRISDEIESEGSTYPAVIYSSRPEWQGYQKVIVYALGRLNAFGALTGVTDVEGHLDVWRVHLILGHLHGQYQLSTPTVQWGDVPALSAQVIQQLQSRFGLTDDEIDRCMSAYESDELYALTAEVASDTQFDLGDTDESSQRLEDT